MLGNRDSTPRGCGHLTAKEAPDMHIRSLSTLDHREVVALAQAAADRGEGEDVNPFPAGCERYRVFADAHAQRASELQPTA